MQLNIKGKTMGSKDKQKKEKKKPKQPKVPSEKKAHQL